MLLSVFQYRLNRVHHFFLVFVGMENCELLAVCDLVFLNLHSRASGTNIAMEYQS